MQTFLLSDVCVATGRLGAIVTTGGDVEANAPWWNIDELGTFLLGVWFKTGEETGEIWLKSFSPEIIQKIKVHAEGGYYRYHKINW